MVKYQDVALDRTFAALADPTRRALLARLSTRDGLSVSELAQPFPVSLPAVMKHLAVLADAGLITRSKSGRVVSCRLDAAPMRAAAAWLAHYQAFWSEQLDRLAAYVEDPSWPSASTPAKPDSASRSRAASQRRRKGSTRRGPSRRT
jgi:DNA-binding transcriptional ArsR family regulator